MLKIIGSLCILCGGVMTRWIQGRAWRKEKELLEELLSALAQMREEVRLRRTPMPYVMERIAKGRCPEVQALFRTMEEAIRRGEELPWVWRETVEELPLRRDDCAALAELSHDFGGDEEQICKGISLAMVELTKRLNEIKIQNPERGRRATALSISAAALLVILLV